jgi:hypothetical protein
MSPWLRRLPLIAAGVMLIPSVILLMFAYLSATTAGHSTTEAVILLLLALALPPSFYGLASVVVWLKRGQAPDADPGSLAARVAKKPYVAFIPVLIMLGLLWLLNGLNDGMKRGDEKHDVFAAMRDTCVTDARKSMQQNGADPNSAKVKAMVDKYCTCIVIQTQVQYTPAEFEKMDALGPAGLANDKKFMGLIDQCSKQATEP